MNRPYVKQYDASGQLINPIDGFYPSKTIRPEFPLGFPNRRERRDALVNQKRKFNNKKGLQLVVTKIGALHFMKYSKHLQNIDGKQVVHYVNRSRNLRISSDIRTIVFQDEMVDQ